MPIYEYKCLSCKNRFEKLISFLETNDGVKCPKCESKNCQKLISKFGFRVGSSFTSSSSSSCSTCTAPSCSSCH